VATWSDWLYLAAISFVFWGAYLGSSFSIGILFGCAVGAYLSTIFQRESIKIQREIIENHIRRNAKDLAAQFFRHLSGGRRQWIETKDLPPNNLN
jgi:hypothetical protein